MPITASPPPDRRIALWFGLVMAVLCAVPFVFARYPQMSDYPAHLARYRIMLDGGSSPDLARFYAFTWQWSGNLGVDILIRPLAQVLGLETAARIIAAMIPVLTGLGLLAVEWALRRRIGMGALLAMAAIWSPALALGFLNFTLSLALALFAFALWVELKAWRWRALLFVPTGLMVWLCHQSGWGVLGILVLGHEWQVSGWRRALIAPWPLLAPLIPALLLGSGAAGALSYGKLIGTYKWGIWWRALRVEDQWLDVGTAGLLALAVLLALGFRRIDGRLGRAALILGVLATVMPRHLAGGDYADYRLTAVALMLGCLAMDWVPSRRAAWLAPALLALRLAGIASVWQRDSAELDAMLQGVNHLPQGAVLAQAVLFELDDWHFGHFEHAAGYAVVRRDALVNTNFAVKGVHMLAVRAGGRATGRGRGDDFIDPSQRIFHVRGAPVDLSAFPPARGAGYLWFIGTAPVVRLPPGAVVILRTPRSILARLANPPRPR